MRRLLSAVSLAAVAACASGCVHARWPAKTLADGVAISPNVVNATIPQLRALRRPAGIGFFTNERLPQERQVYRMRVVLLRFSLASDGDIHLAIADPHDPASTMIAEIPDPDRMNGAPARYRDEVARARRNFIGTFGAPAFGVWRPAGRQVEIAGPIFFDLLAGQAGGPAAGAPNAVEIHPVLRIHSVQGEPREAMLTPAESANVDAIANSALHDYQIPGMSIAIVRNGRTVYSRGYGFSNVATLQAAQPATQYQIGSVTKQFTAALILQLARHDLSLDDPVTKYFPFFHNASKVRIRDLLDQRSGIADYNSAWMLAAAAPQLFRGAVGHEGLARVVAGRSLAFRPDTMFQYSNSNYLLLGLIAERVTRHSLASLFETRFFAPLGMRRTLLGMASYCRDGAACGYSKTPLGVSTITPWRSDWTYSAGGITSTAPDLAKWDIALMSGRILPARDFAAMTRPRSGSGYGYGVFVSPEGGDRIIWHDGTVYGFKAMNSLVLPERDAVVVLCNADYAHAADVAAKIESALFHVPGGGGGEPADLQLPVFAFSLAALAGLLPVGAMVIFRRRFMAGGLFALAAYVTGVYFWPAGLALAIAGLSAVAWKPRRAAGKT